MNFGFAMVRRRSPQVLDFGLRRRAVRKIICSESLFVNNPKSKACPEPCRRIQNLKWVGIFAIAFTFAFGGAGARAQQPAKLPRIGYLAGTADRNNPTVEAFRQGLRDLGYTEGKNIQLEFRYTEGRPDPASNLVAELVQLKVDVLVITQGQAAIREAQQATKTIPIVMVTTVEPVAAGLIDSLAHPGGNLTGLTTLARDLSGKRLELLKEVVPTTLRVGFLLQADAPGAAVRIKEYEDAARPLKIEIQSLNVQSQTPDFDGAFKNADKGRVSGLITVRDALFHRYQKQIANLAIKHRLPSMFERSDYVEAGGLISYSSDDAEIYRRAAYYVDKILKGTKPGGLPVEQPKKFHLVINLKTAKQIGLRIPPSVLARADRVIK
jgi:putative tryptophan/tyrosine transport system substrate-binding protein